MTYPIIDLPQRATHYDLAFEDYPGDTHEAADVHLVSVLGEVADERYRQDQRWGGPEHDDGHSVWEWKELLRAHVDRLTPGPRITRSDYRERLIEVAALCVAAAQAWDRKQAAPSEAGEHVHPEPAED